MTELRRRLLEDWPVKVVAVVFAVALWAFVVAGLIAALSAALLIRTMTTLFKIERIIFGR